eukprot:990201-Pelagomonas_calceolata.AAC.1
MDTLMYSDGVHAHAQVFRPGSTSAGTKLWDARELFEANDARCDKALRQLGASLKDAVTMCIQAAGAQEL